MENQGWRNCSEELERVRCSEINSYARKIKWLARDTDFLLDGMLDTMLDVFSLTSPSVRWSSWIQLRHTATHRDGQFTRVAFPAAACCELSARNLASSEHLAVGLPSQRKVAVPRSVRRGWPTLVWS